MLYPICPTCGELLGNIQLAYRKDMEELCKKLKIDHDEISLSTNDDKINKEKAKILDKYTRKDRYCCRMRLSNSLNIVKLVN
jgi:DNA-directed RNA polymerase subunit N (RpoN/RPB10)